MKLDDILQPSQHWRKSITSFNDAVFVYAKTQYPVSDKTQMYMLGSNDAAKFHVSRFTPEYGFSLSVVSVDLSHGVTYSEFGRLKHYALGYNQDIDVLAVKEVSETFDVTAWIDLSNAEILDGILFTSFLYTPDAMAALLVGPAVLVRASIRANGELFASDVAVPEFFFENGAAEYFIKYVMIGFVKKQLKLEVGEE